MYTRFWHRYRRHFGLFMKCGSVFCLFLVSVLVIACGGTNTQTFAPQVTVTIDLNKTFASPTPTLPPFSCGAWVTQSTPIYYPGAVVSVYAKFVQSVNGNPQGMANAHAHAIVYWPDGTQTPYDIQTTSDGLASFPVVIQASAVGHVALVEVDFTSADGAHTCNVTDTKRAFFTAFVAAPSPTPTNNNPFPFLSPTPPFGQ